MVSEYLSGASIERIAYTYHRAPQVVRNALHTHGVPTRSRGESRRVSAEQRLLFVKEYQGGSTLELIGSKYGRSPGTVRNVLSDSGVKMRRTGRPHSLTPQQSCADEDSHFRQQARARMRAARFGGSLDHFDNAWEKQNGQCAICEVSMKPYGRYNDSVAVDHDHCTGVARSLVCQMCNKGLGQFRDSPDYLRKAASYLEIHRGI